MAELDEQNTPSARPREKSRRVRRLLWSVLTFPFRLALLLAGLVERFILGILTVLVVAYFLLTTSINESFVENLLNQELLGSFHIDHLHWSVFSDEVELFGVTIEHPDDYVVVQVNHLRVNFDRLALVTWGAGKIVGKNDPIPLHFRRTELQGYYVRLPFDDTGFRFVDTFNPRVVTAGPAKAPMPHLTFDQILLGTGEVDIEFPGWRMDVAVLSGISTLEISADGIDIEAYDLDGDRFTLTGNLLPENLRFIGNQPSQFFFPAFHLNREMLTVKSGRIQHPDLDAEVDFTLWYPRRNHPVDASAQVRVLNPQRLSEISQGHVSGVAHGTIQMTGSISSPRIEGDLSSPLITVQMLELLGVDAHAVVQVGPTVKVEVSHADATVWEAGVSLRNGTLELPKDDLVSLRFDACVDGLSPPLLLDNFGIFQLPLAEDSSVNACITEGSIDVGTSIDIRGRLEARIDGGTFLRGLGITEAILQTDLRVSPDQIQWSALEFHAPIVELLSSGKLNLGEDLLIDAHATAANVPLADSPFLAKFGIDGSVDHLALDLVGPLLAPRIDLDLSGDSFHFAGNTLHWLDVRAELANGIFDVPLLCLKSGPNTGCIDFTAKLSGNRIEDIHLPVELDLAIREPLHLDLESIPFLDLPVSGTVTVNSALLTASVTDDPMESLANLEGDIALQAENFSGPSFHLGTAQATIHKKQTDPANPIGGFDAEVHVAQFGAPGIEMASITAKASLLRYDGWPEDEPLPVISGGVELQIDDANLDGNAIRRVQLQAQSDPEQSRIDASARILLPRGLSLEVSAEIDTGNRTIGARLDFQNFPLQSIPGLPSDALPAWLEPVQAAGYLRVVRGDLEALLDGNLELLAKTLVGDASLTLRNLENLPEPASSLSARFSMKRGRIGLTQTTLVWKNRSELSLDGWIDPWSEKLDMKVRQSPASLNAWTLLRGMDLPVELSAGLDAHLEGALKSPTITAHIGVRNLVAAGIVLGNAALRLTGRIGDRVAFKSDDFFPGFKLQKGEFVFDDGIPAYINVDLDFSEFKLKQAVPSVPEEIEASASGSISAHVDLRPGREPFVVTVAIPRKQLKACSRFKSLKLCAHNQEDSGILVDSRALTVKNLAITSPGHQVSVDGELDFRRGWNVDVGFTVDLSRFKILSEVFASYAGLLLTGDKPVHISGAMQSPELSGDVELKDVSLLPRNFESELVIANAAIQLRGNLVKGNVLAILPEDAPLVGGMDEGYFKGHGWFRLLGWKPDGGVLYASGRDIYYQQPGEYRILVSPRLEIELRNLTVPEKAKSRISGELQVTEGEYTRDFDRLLGSFATAFSRSQQRYSTPITEIFPFLSTTELDLTVRGGNFTVSSRFPFGETELTVDLDLRVGGTPENLTIYDRMRVVPGGVITYKVVKRVFEVVQGNVDFSGDPAHPYLDVKARTEILYRAPDDYATTWSLQEREWGRPVVIEIHITGEYPNITFDLSSDSPEFDVADLQTLLLLGMTRRDLEGRNDSGSADVSINILTEDVAGLVSKLILAPFVDAVSLGFTQEGGIRAETETRIGRAMNLNTQVRQDSTRSEYSAGFQFKITDRLSLEGKMKMIQEDSESLRNYEAKFRYLIPLD